MKSCTFWPTLGKIKKFHPEKNFFYFRKWDFSALILKKLSYFLRKFQETELFYTSGNGSPPKISYIFSKESCSYILGNGNHEIFFLHFRKWNFLIFRERIIQNPDIFKNKKHIQNHGIFRIRDIFRTLSIIYDGKFCKEIVS